MEFVTENIDVSLKTMPGWFFMFRPLRVPYDKLAMHKGGAMWEKAVSFGRGWIGVEDPQGDTKIQGEFKSYLHHGSYKALGAAFQEIMRQHPTAREYYSIYLNSPREVSEDQLQTKVLFR